MTQTQETRRRKQSAAPQFFVGEGMGRGGFQWSEIVAAIPVLGQFLQRRESNSLLFCNGVAGRVTWNTHPTTRRAHAPPKAPKSLRGTCEISEPAALDTKGTPPMLAHRGPNEF